MIPDGPGPTSRGPTPLLGSRTPADRTLAQPAKAPLTLRTAASGPETRALAGNGGG